MFIKNFKKILFKNNSLLKKKNEQGFALLLAVLVAGILLSVTYLMFSINLKQLSLSTAGKNSQTALFAADTGIECAEFYDNHIDGAFAGINLDNSNNRITLTSPALAGGGDMSCAGGDKNIPSFTPVQNGTVKANSTIYPNNASGCSGVCTYVTEFEIPPDTAKGSTVCTFVTVSKYIYSESGTGGRASDRIGTKIEARGYNICPPTTSNTTDDNNPLRVERGLEVYY
jgi:hypothetical protein